MDTTNATAIATLLDDAAAKLAAPRNAPSVSFTLTGRRGAFGSYIHILDGRTMDRGTRAGCTSFSTIRRWAEMARADGVTGIRLELRRHTRALGYRVVDDTRRIRGHVLDKLPSVASR